MQELVGKMLETEIEVSATSARLFVGEGGQTCKWPGMSVQRFAVVLQHYLQDVNSVSQSVNS